MRADPGYLQSLGNMRTPISRLIMKMAQLYRNDTPAHFIVQGCAPAY